MKLRYFAWVRERAGLSEEEVELPAEAATVADVIAWLKTRGPGFEHAFAEQDCIRAAIDRAQVGRDASVAEAREIAFFPPVTGG